MIIRPKGTKDVLPGEIDVWTAVESIIRDTLRIRDFKEIRTPVFEHTELFVRGVGEGSDIVNKEMYTFMDKGERSLTLKPEGTASIARAVVENGLDNEALPLKLFTYTPCFRYERPQTGRLREHHQFSIEAFGSYSPAMDAEVIGTIKMVLDKLNFHNYTININSIGCPDCRKRYLEELKAYYSKYINTMCEDCKVRYQKNALRLLDCKEEGCKKFKESAPKPIDYLCDDCKNHFEGVKSCLDNAGVKYAINVNLVRGIDYYTRTVFEFLTTEKGALNVICGGGRYDGLIEGLGGKSLPAVGVGLGIEHLLLLLEKNNVPVRLPDYNNLYIVSQNSQVLSSTIRLANEIRALGMACDYDLMDRSFKAQMKYANKIGAKFIVVLGETELQTGRVLVKRMADGATVECQLGAKAIINTMQSMI